MSYKYVELENIEGIRKVKWDGLWHILYRWNNRDTYDRVDKRKALRVLKRIQR